MWSGIYIGGTGINELFPSLSINYTALPNESPLILTSPHPSSYPNCRKQSSVGRPPRPLFPPHKKLDEREGFFIAPPPHFSFPPTFFSSAGKKPARPGWISDWLRAAAAVLISISASFSYHSAGQKKHTPLSSPLHSRLIASSSSWNGFPLFLGGRQRNPREPRCTTSSFIASYRHWKKPSRCMRGHLLNLLFLLSHLLFEILRAVRPSPSPEKIEPPTLYFYPFTVSASAAGAFGGTWTGGLVQREERGGPPTRTDTLGRRTDGREGPG